MSRKKRDNEIEIVGENIEESGFSLIADFQEGGFKYEENEFTDMRIPVLPLRNMVLFPEKINGLYTRLERPFPVYSRGGVDRFDIWYAQSPDLKFWGNNKLLLSLK